MARVSQSKLIEKAAQALALHGVSRASPTLALILGSGFVPILQDLPIEDEIGFDSIPGFPPVQVPGHDGKMIITRIGQSSVLIFCGRTHYYEGHSMDAITFPVRVLARLGIRHLLLTNAAGGLNPRFRSGDLMVITDHINFMGANPLRGLPFPHEHRFVDLSKAYDSGLIGCLRQAARKQSIPLKKGVYLAVSGPSYETPAEIRVFRQWGADAVGMSTVPEVIVARQCGLQVAALSCITNPAAGLCSQPLSHKEVLKVGHHSCQTSSKLIQQFIREYAQDFPANADRSRH